MRITGIAVALIVAGCAGAAREAPQETGPVAGAAALSGASGCPMESCPMHGAGAAAEGGGDAAMRGAGPGAGHHGAGSMHGAGAGHPAGSMHGAGGTMHQGAGCPMHARASAADVSVPEAAHAEPGEESTPDPEGGRVVFRGRGNCYTCHGPDAKGTALAPDLTDDEWLHADGSPESLRRVILHGVRRPIRHPGPMPPTGGAQLTEEDVRNLVAFIRSLAD